MPIHPIDASYNHLIKASSEIIEWYSKEQYKDSKNIILLEIWHLQQVSKLLNDYLLHKDDLSDKYWDDIRKVYLSKATNIYIYHHYVGWEFLSIVTKGQSYYENLQKECELLVKKNSIEIDEYYRGLGRNSMKSESKMKIVTGDLLKLALENKFDVIVHGCNCFCTMGAGIAKAIKQTFPRAYEEDLKTEKGDKSKLGKISFVKIKLEKGDLIVVNGYTQYNWKGSGRKVDYNAIRNVFQKIKKEFSGLKIAYPAIGAGLAGGDWKIISEIINEELEGENHSFVKFEN